MTGTPKNRFAPVTKVWLQQFLIFSRGKGKDIDLNAHNCLPYPGHMLMFLECAFDAINRTGAA